MRTVPVAAAILVGVLAGLTTPALAQEKTFDSSFSPAQLAERTQHRRAIEAVIWGMPAVNADLIPGCARGQRRLQPGRLLVAARQFGKSDAHAQPRHDLSHALLQHEGCRADGAGDSAGG
jgi:hypothetical protein